MIFNPQFIPYNKTDENENPDISDLSNRCGTDEDKIDPNQVMSHCLGVKVAEFVYESGLSVLEFIILTGGQFCAPCKLIFMHS